MELRALEVERFTLLRLLRTGVMFSELFELSSVITFCCVSNFFFMADGGTYRT